MSMTMTEFAPTPVPIEEQHNYSSYPQLMATPWDPQYVGIICSIEVKNKCAALEEEESHDSGVSREGGFRAGIGLPAGGFRAGIASPLTSQR
jgi:hypothetical protein